MPFRDVIGHRRIVDLLRRSVAGGSLPPSLIFTGPEGIGKRLVAVSVAQALNCPTTADCRLSTVDCDSCGTCAVCARIARGAHPDVFIVEPGESGSIKIEAVRDVVDHAGYRPFEGRRRVVIIDQADALVPAAQNALLKTLEEPPPSSVFILVSSRPDVLLPTVRSRCPLLRFRPIAANEIADALVAKGRSQKEARALAATVDGSLGRALAADTDDPDHLIEARNVAHRVLARAVTTPDPRRRIETARDLLAGTGKGGATDREQLRSHLEAMASLLRDTELLSARGAPGALANPDVRPAIEQLVPAYEGGRGRRAFVSVDRARMALERNASVKIVADWLVLQL